MPVGDVYQIVDTQVQDGQTMLNVYFYKVQSMSVTDNTAADVAQAFIDHVLPDVVAVQSTVVLHTQIEAKNLFNEADAHTIAISAAGEAGGSDAFGTFEAFGFQLIGDNHAVRNGAKRVPGVFETGVVDGVVTSSTLITALNALAAIYFSNMPWGLLAAEILIPVIVKRIHDGSEYRLPTNSGEAVTSRIVDSGWSPLVTSQVSRKVGRGE